MENLLVEYLLNGLDDPTRQKVEDRLGHDPTLQKRLDILRQALAPLEADRDGVVPPPSLIPNTIALVAEHMCRPLPQAPPPKREAGLLARPWWRRADVLIAACLVIAALGIAAPLLVHSQRARQQTVQCQENLRLLYTALEDYHFRHGRYPHVAEEKPRDVAGMALPILREARSLAEKKPLLCPGVKEPNASLASLDELRGMAPVAFANCAPTLNPTYAYHLGHVNGDNAYHAPDKVAAGFRSLMPLMADAPPCDGSANSANHGGVGQNVLFQDGHVRFVTSRNVGVGGDDIFLNKGGRVAAGLDPMDAVLGCSAAKP